jgi:RNA polymerase sigma factor (sigma-70 family)
MPDRNQGGFPQTRLSAITALRQGNEAERKLALGRVIEIYWPAVYKYLRLRWHKDSDSAADLTQGFFLSALEKEFLADFDPAKARFRTFLRLCLDRFVGKADQAASRQKRGGEAQHFSLDFDFIERQLTTIIGQRELAPDELFEREWIRNLFASAVEQLKTNYESEGKVVHYAIFEAYDLQSLDSDARPSYSDLAATHSITVETVTNYLSAARRDFRRIVLERIREVTATDTEFRDEVRAVLGIEV